MWRSRLSGHLLVAALLYLPPQASPACRPEYRVPGTTHTACKPPNRRCIIKGSGMSDKDKAETLKAHNDYRSKVAQGKLRGFSPATNMLQLEWDDELAEVAQAFTDLCDISRHDRREERITTKFQRVGQNYAYSFHPSEHRLVEGPATVTDWFDEYKSFHPSAVRSFRTSGAVVTHFTQVIWAQTRYVGCGFTLYDIRGSNDGYPFKRFLACNYGSMGNTIGQPVYEEGATCSNCPQGTTCNTGTGLCAGPHASGNAVGVKASMGLVFAAAMPAFIRSFSPN